MKRFAIFAALLLGSAVFLPTIIAQSSSPSAAEHPDWPGHGQLFVGTCYQPIDRSPEEIHRDIGLMKQAGFSLVRMGDLSWDSFEPAENQFDFAWFDRILDEMHAANIKVILDMGGLPAPIWLHHKYPSVNVVTQEGVMLHPAERYMVNIADPIYRAHVIHFADELTKHYAHNPTLAAIGYDNEIGSGFMSYSAADRERFIAWLKVKYSTIEALNKAWATQRWSRHLNSFDEVELPYGEGPGPGERYLDLHRFWSDITISVLQDLEKIREGNTPNLPAVSNLWDTNPRRGFDYLSSYKKYVSYGAEGFYPVDPLHASVDVLLTKGDLPTPTWYNEFVTGGPGNYGTKGTIRMWAYVGLIDYGQTYLAWTFNTHQGGEEQALFGLLDHDGTPSWKYREFAQIASEFAKLEHFGFPRYHKPDVAIAYSFDSLIASRPTGSSTSVRKYFTTDYREQVDSSLQPFFEDNIDAALINVAHAKLDYKLLVVPADFVMDAGSANAIRNYVRDGGTVVMTALSAKLNEHGQWFNTPVPGRLNDVFGIRTEEFYRPATTPEFLLDGVAVKTAINFYEILELRGAQPLASFTNTPDKSPAITINTYGKGRAIYLAVPAQMAALAPLMHNLYSTLDIPRGPETPSGVYARVVEGRTLYVNTTEIEKSIAIQGKKHGVLSGQTYDTVLHLKPHDADLLE